MGNSIVHNTKNIIHARNFLLEYTIAQAGCPLDLYSNCLKDVCLCRHIFGEAFQQKRIAFLYKTQIEKPLINRYEDIITQIIIKAVECSPLNIHTATINIDGITNGCAYSESIKYFSMLQEWERIILTLALRQLLEVEDSSGLLIILALLCRGAQQCKARVRASFDTIISRINIPEQESSTPPPLPPPSSHNDTTSVASGEENDVEEICDDGVVNAKTKLQAVILEYLEDFKDRAFQTTFIEPTKMYFRSQSNVNENEVDIHGSNIYLALLSCTIGIRFNRSPLMDDEWILGCADFLSARMNEALDVLWDDTNFGKSFESIAECKSAKSTVVPCNRFIFDGLTPLDIALGACDPFQRNKDRRNAFIPYITHFCSYFRSEFLLPRMLSHILQDELAERWLEEIFAFYRIIWNIEDDNVRFWLWDTDVDPPLLDTDRALRLFSVFGITNYPPVKENDNSHAYPVINSLEHMKKTKYIGCSIYFESKAHLGSEYYLTVSGHTDGGSGSGSGIVTTVKGKKYSQCQWVVEEGPGNTVVLRSILHRGSLLACKATGELYISSEYNCNDLNAPEHRLPSEGTSAEGESSVTDMNVNMNVHLDLDLDCHWVMEDVEDSPRIILGSATHSGRHIRCNPFGALDTTPNRQAWEMWTVSVLAQPQSLSLSQSQASSQSQPRVVTSPFENYLGRLVTFVTTRHGLAPGQGALLCHPDGSVSLGLEPHPHCRWCVDDAGNGTVVVSSAIFPAHNLQCNRNGRIGTSKNTLAWEQWVFVADSGGQDDRVYLLSFGFPDKYLTCNSKNEICTTTIKSQAEVWNLVLISY
eukprot:gene11011-23006_t